VKGLVNSPVIATCTQSGYRCFSNFVSYIHVEQQDYRKDYHVLPLSVKETSQWRIGKCVWLVFDGCTTDLYSMGAHQTCIWWVHIRLIFDGCTSDLYSMGAHQTCIRWVHIRLGFDGCTSDLYSMGAHQSGVWAPSKASSCCFLKQETTLLCSVLVSSRNRCEI